MYCSYCDEWREHGPCEVCGNRTSYAPPPRPPKRGLGDGAGHCTASTKADSGNASNLKDIGS